MCVRQDTRTVVAASVGLRVGIGATITRQRRHAVEYTVAVVGVQNGLGEACVSNSAYSGA